MKINRKTIIIMLIVFCLMLFLLSNKIYKKRKQGVSIELTNISSIDKMKYGEIEKLSKKLLVFYDLNLYYVLDLSGKELAHSNKKINVYDSFDNDISYYSIENKLYDYTGKELFDELDKYDKVSNIYGNYLLLTKGEDLYLIDINTKNIKNIESFYGDYNGIIVCSVEDGYIVFDGNEKLYYTLEERNNYSFVHLKNNDDDLYLGKNKGKISADNYYKENLNDTYYLDYNDCGKLKNTKDFKTVSNECFNTYKKINENYFILTNNNGELYSLDNGNIGKYGNIGYIDVIDDGLISYDESEKLYYLVKKNSSKDLIDCSGFVYKTGNNVLACNDLASGYFIENGKIRDDKYDSLSCKSNYCIVKKDNKYGLYYMGEKLVDTKYFNIKSYEDFFIIDTVNKCYILYKEEGGKPLSKDQLNPNPEDINYNSIDIDELISKYNLDKDIINDNKDLFYKYAYYIENNKNIEKIKKQLYVYFNFIVEKKKYLDEQYFFSKLKTLKASYTDKIEHSASGVYYTDDNSISVLKIAIDSSTVYHELMHFIDYSINNNSFEYILCDNKILENEEYSKLTIKEKKECSAMIDEEPLYIIEGGDDFYNTQYLYEGSINTPAYVDYRQLFAVLDYIYGHEFADDIYFGNKSLVMLISKILNYENAKEFGDLSNKILNFNEYKTDDEYAKFFDYLVEMNKKQKNIDDIRQDKTFIKMLAVLIKAVDIENLKKSKYYDIYFNAYNELFNEINEIEEKVDNSKINWLVTGVITGELNICYYNDELYLFIGGYDNSSHGTLIFEYNVDKKEYKFVKYLKIK